MAVGSPDAAVRSGLSKSATGHCDIRTFCAMTDGVAMIHCGQAGESDIATITRNRASIAMTEPGPRADSAGGTLIWALPGFPCEGAFGQATELFAQSGAPESVAFEALGTMRDGSIVARLHEAAYMLTLWLGMPDRVCAFASGPRMTRVAEEHPDSASRTLRHWSGSLSVNCQFQAGRVATILASNQASHWQRRAMAVGSMGSVAVDDHAIHWRDKSGATIERSSCLQEGGSDPIVAIAAASLRSGGAFELASGLRAGTHCRAFVEAACLSALTGEPESPATMEQLLREL